MSTDNTKQQVEPSQLKTTSRQAIHVAYLWGPCTNQELDNQRKEILEFIEKEGLQPFEYFEEKVSVKSPVTGRDLGRKVLPFLQEGDALIVTELSRLGRNLVEIMTVLNVLVDKGVRVYAVKGGHRLDGTVSAEVLNSVLQMTAGIERELVSQHAREALESRNASGKQKEGFGDNKLDRHEDEIRKLAAEGVSKASMARMFDCTWPAMDAWMQRKGISIKRG